MTRSDAPGRAWLAGARRGVGSGARRRRVDGVVLSVAALTTAGLLSAWVGPLLAAGPARAASAATSGASSAAPGATAWVEDTSPDEAGVDFETEQPGWNALHYLRTTADEAEVTLQARRTLDFATLRGDEILLVVAPVTTLSAEGRQQLLAFVRAGGRLIIADDFRAGASWMSPFGLALHDRPGAAPGVVEGRPGLLRFPGVAVGGALGYQVRELVLNHPAAITTEASAAKGEAASLASRPDRSPTARLAQGRYEDGVRAFLYEVQLGRGRVLALADPSVLIDGMLRAFHGNKQFAANLLRWGCYRGEPCRVALLANLAAVTGVFRPAPDLRPGGRPQGALQALAAALDGIAEALRSPAARWFGGALTLATLLLPLWRFGRLPQPRLPPSAGDAPARGRLQETIEAWMMRPEADFRQPARLLAQRLARRLQEATHELEGDVLLRASRGGSKPPLAAASEATEQPVTADASLARLQAQIERLRAQGGISSATARRLGEVVAAFGEVARAAEPIDRARFASLAAEIEWAEHVLSHTRPKGSAGRGERSRSGSQADAGANTGDDARLGPSVVAAAGQGAEPSEELR